MAKLFKRPGSPYWYALIRNGRGSERKFSTRQEDKGNARLIANKAEREWILADSGDDIALEAALELVRAKKIRAQAAEGTMDFLSYKGGHLMRLLGGDRRLGRVTLRLCEQYMEQRLSEGVGKHTIAKELGVLKSALAIARRHGYAVPASADIWPDGLRGAYVPRKRWLEFPEYEFIRDTLPASRREHFTVYCYTGVRNSELYVIHARDIDGDRVFVDGTKTGGSKRWLPMAPPVAEILRTRALLYPNGPLFPDRWAGTNLATSCSRAAKRYGAHLAGVDFKFGGPAPKAKFRWNGRVSANDLRRTFCSWLANAGVPEAHTVKLMGHTSSAMVRRVYAQLADTTLADAVSRLPSGLTVGGTGDRIDAHDAPETQKARAKLLSRGI